MVFIQLPVHVDLIHVRYTYGSSPLPPPHVSVSTTGTKLFQLKDKVGIDKVGNERQRNQFGASKLPPFSFVTRFYQAIFDECIGFMYFWDAPPLPRRRTDALTKKLRPRAREREEHGGVASSTRRRQVRTQDTT